MKALGTPCHAEGVPWVTIILSLSPLGRGTQQMWEGSPLTSPNEPGRQMASAIAVGLSVLPTVDPAPSQDVLCSRR